MKKGYVYFLPPVLALAAFIAVWWGFSTQHKAKLDAFAKSKEDAKIAAKAKADSDTLAAFQKAEQEGAARKLKREADDKKRDQDAKDLEAAVNARAKAKNDSVELSNRAQSLEKDKEILQKEVDSIALDKKAAELEQDHMKKLVVETQANVAMLNNQLKKIQDSRDLWMQRVQVEQARAKATQGK